MKIQPWMLEPAGTIQACDHHDGAGGLNKLEWGALIITAANSGGLLANTNKNTADHLSEFMDIVSRDSTQLAVRTLAACHEAEAEKES